MKRLGVGQRRELGRLQPGAGVLADDVGGVEVDVDALDGVGDPDLGEDVVGRVVVDDQGALGGLQPAGHLRLARGGQQVGVGLGRPAAYDEHRGVADLQRGHGPVARLAAQRRGRRPRSRRRATRPPPPPADRGRARGTGRRCPSRRSSGTGVTPVRSRASASRCACQASYCHFPSTRRSPPARAPGPPRRGRSAGRVGGGRSRPRLSQPPGHRPPADASWSRRRVRYAISAVLPDSSIARS